MGKQGESCLACRLKPPKWFLKAETWPWWQPWGKYPRVISKAPEEMKQAKSLATRKTFLPVMLFRMVIVMSFLRAATEKYTVSKIPMEIPLHVFSKQHCWKPLFHNILKCRLSCKGRSVSNYTRCMLPINFADVSLGEPADGLGCWVILSLAASTWHGPEFYQEELGACKLSIPRALQLVSESVCACLGLQRSQVKWRHST